MIDRLLKLSQIFEIRTRFLLKTALSKFADELAPFVSTSFSDSLFRNYLHNSNNEVIKQWLMNNRNILINANGNGNWEDVGFFIESKLNNKTYRICVKEDLDNASLDVKINQSVFLPGLDSIPNLYLVDGVFVNPKQFKDYNTDLLVHDPAFAHDAFLVIALGKLFGVKRPESIKTFIRLNLDKINEIKKMFYGTPKYLGGGTDGVAFSIAPNRVLKIFRDDYSYNKAREAQVRLHKNPALAKTEAMIYDVGILGEANGQSAYYYIMEKMKPINSLSNTVSHNIETILNAAAIFINRIAREDDAPLNVLKKNFEDPTKHEEIKKELQPYIQQVISSLNVSHSQVIRYITDNTELKENWLPLFIEELLVKYMSGRTDLHGGNLGVTNYGELRYFDPAYGAGGLI